MPLPCGRQGREYFLTPSQIEQFYRDGYVNLAGVKSESEPATIECDFDQMHSR